jgi:hypothetical protein
MDPQTAWDDLLVALGKQDWDRVEDLAEGLLRWLRANGFPPRAVTGSDLGPDWDREIAAAGCRFALALAREGVAHVP